MRSWIVIVIFLQEQEVVVWIAEGVDCSLVDG